MVRKHIGIERLLNMINIAHSMTKILPYIDNMFYEYRNMSAQEFRHKLNELGVPFNEMTHIIYVNG